MKIERNRAAGSGARKARRYNVSPVTRAIRSVLTVSAAALAFSGTGLALAKTPSAPSAIAAPRATLADQALHQIPASVVDLTVVHDASLPTSVVDGAFDLHAALADPDAQLAAGPGSDGRIDRVLDLTSVPMLAPGPGDGTSGTTNDVGYNLSLPGSGYQWWTLNPGFSYTANSPDGYAVGFFGTADSMRIDSHWDIDVVGYAWAAGIEVESLLGDTIVNQMNTVDATATGTYGTAVGVYGYAAGSTTLDNQGAIVATANGYHGEAIGALGYAVAGDAIVDNSAGSIVVAAQGGYGSAFGIISASVDGNANAGNGGTMQVDGYYATGLFARAMGDGDATADNSGTLTVNGVDHAYGARAIAADGTASAHNSGILGASAYGNAVGLLAEGEVAVATNSGLLTASARVGTGVGILAIGDVSVDVDNSGRIDASSTYGSAYGIYAASATTIVDNGASIGASSTFYNAAAILAYGAVVDVDNAGSLSADAYGISAGVFALGGDIDVTNGGSIVANANGPYGEAIGVFAGGQDIDVGNTGGITVAGQYATGIDARGGNVIVANDGTVDATGGLYGSAILARSATDGGIAAVENTGDLTANGGVFASGIEAISRNYLGTASVTNSGYVGVASQYGDVQGIVAAADRDATITNAGTVFVEGGTSAYAILGLSADGDVVVDNTNGDIFAYASSRDSVAYGVAAQSNNGHVQVTNGGTLYAIADNATGIYASTKWNDVDVTNDGDMVVVGYNGAAMGIQGINYTGTTTLANTGSIYAGGGYSGVGMWSISLYGDAHVDNSSAVETFGGVLDRGLMSRTLFGGTASIDNSGSVTTYSGVSSYGAWARSDSGLSEVHNSGSIHSESVFGYGYGVIAGGALGADVTNDATGSIFAYGGYSAGGVLAYSNGGDVNVTNAGDIIGVSYYSASGISASAYGNATVANTGFVGGHAFADNAFGIDASAGGDVHVTNGGTIVADTVYGSVADGIFAIGENVVVDNTGTIEASAYNWAAGIEAIGYATADASNHDTITATVVDGQANGIFAYGYEAATVLNAGDIGVNAAYGYAMGMAAYAYGTAKATNCDCGTIDANVGSGDAYGLLVEGNHAIAINDGGIVATSGNGDATGIFVRGGSVVVGNAGDVHASGTGQAIAIGAYGQFDDSTVTVDNSGSLYAAVGGEKYGMVGGIIANAAGDVGVTNSGDITTAGGVIAFGVMAQSDSGVHVTNDGDIHMTGVLAMGAGIRATVGYGDVVVDGAGNVTIESGKYGVGILASAYDGNADVDVSGDITVSAYGYAIGIRADAEYGDAHVASNGTVTVDGHEYGDVTGINAAAWQGNASIANGGAVHATTVYGTAVGLYGEGETVGIANTGDVTVSGGDVAVGIGAYAYTGATITNGGAVTVTQTGMGESYVPALVVEDGNAIGIGAYVESGNATITNDGSVDVTAYDNATGIQAFVHDGAIVVGGTGDITATAENGDAAGIDAVAEAYAGPSSVTIANGGDIVATSAHHAAEGVFAMGTTVDVQNGGGISATGYGWAAAIDAVGDAVTIGNEGTLHASITGAGEYTGAAGIYAYGASSLAIDNGGDILVEAAHAGAYGVVAYSYVNAVSVANSGTIAASGVHASGIEVFTEGEATVDNGGDVRVHGGAGAIGVLAEAGTIHFANAGHIDVAATDGHATGAELFGTDVSFANAGSLAATAAGDTAHATGVMVVAPSSLLVQNDGDIHAVATGAHGVAVGFLGVDGPGFAFGNAGNVTATSAYLASGVILHNVTGDMAVVNGGQIGAESDGAAMGLQIDNTGTSTIDNTGVIFATATGGEAVALSLHAGHGVVENSGTILAQGATDASIAVSGGDGVEDIRNGGDIVGSFDLGAGDDLFTNRDGGTWFAIGATDFGAGDDHIVNEAGGTIVLENATVSLGSNSTLGNAFDNAGTIAVLGDSFIDMGTGAVPLVAAPNAAPIDVLNPAAFANDGVITFLDGAPDDVLTIAGDFAGEGAINLDVSMLHGTSDALYIDGNIVDGTVQALNVIVLDMPTTGGDIDIPVVTIAGESQAGQFIAGTFTVGEVVFSQSNFLDLGVDVVHHDDAAAADMFSLQLTFDGINDNGSLAASIAPGAQSLMAAHVGTFRQRMGVLSQLGGSDKGGWVRVFSDKGTIDPDAVMDNLPQGGNFAFEQRNTGVEAGYDVHVTDGVFIGATLATATGKQSLERGIGSDDIDGDTIGAHLTWLGTNGMYADLSYRWMHFDAELMSAGGRQAVGGDAGALNLEAGWNVWSADGGLKLVPQVQYTRTTVSDIDPVRGDLADFVSDGTTSSRLRAGLEFQQTFKTEQGSWTPYGTISAIHEFQGESRFAIADTFTGHTSTEGTSGMLELGANVNMGRLNVWGGINWIDGGAIDSVLGGQIGVRYTW